MHDRTSSTAVSPIKLVRYLGFSRNTMYPSITYVSLAVYKLTQECNSFYQIKPHGAVYGMIARDMALARAAAEVDKTFGVPIMGLAGTCHQQAAAELGVPFIAGTVTMTSKTMLMNLT